MPDVGLICHGLAERLVRYVSKLNAITQPTESSMVILQVIENGVEASVGELGLIVKRDRNVLAVDSMFDIIYLSNFKCHFFIPRYKYPPITEPFRTPFMVL